MPSPQAACCSRLSVAVVASPFSGANSFAGGLFVAAIVGRWLDPDACGHRWKHESGRAGGAAILGASLA